MKKTRFEASIGSIQLVEKPLNVVIGEQTYTFQPNVLQSYVVFDLMHSYPAVNKNNMTVTLPMLVKSASTAVLNPFNRNHKAEGNPSMAYDPDEDQNEIMGTMILAYVPGAEAYDTLPLVPDEPLPLRVVAVFWKRFEIVRDFLEDIANGIEWKVSMEILHNPDNLMYVDPETHTFYKPNEVPPGVNVARVLGGLGQNDDDEPVLIWGGGTTLNPADESARIYSVTASKEGEIAMTKRAATSETQIVINSDGSRKGTTFSLNGTPIAFEDLWLSVGDAYDGDGDRFSMSFTKVKTEENGFKSTERYEYDGASFKEEGAAMNIMEEAKQVLIAQGYKTPDEVQAVVEAAKKEVREEYKDYLSPDTHQQQVQVAIDTKQAEFDTEKAELQKAFAEKIKVVNERISAIEDAGFEMTSERREKIVAFDVDENGKKEFDAYLEKLKADQSAMIEDLKAAKIAVSDDMKKVVSEYDGVDDPRFVAAKKSWSMVATKLKDNKSEEPEISFTLPGSGEDDNGDTDYGKYV